MTDLNQMSESEALNLIIEIEHMFNFKIPFVWTATDLNSFCFDNYERTLTDEELQACFRSWEWRKGFNHINSEDQCDLILDIIDAGIKQASESSKEK